MAGAVPAGAVVEAGVGDDAGGVAIVDVEARVIVLLAPCDSAQAKDKHASQGDSITGQDHTQTLTYLYFWRHLFWRRLQV